MSVIVPMLRLSVYILVQVLSWSMCQRGVRSTTSQCPPQQANTSEESHQRSSSGEDTRCPDRPVAPLACTAEFSLLSAQAVLSVRSSEYRGIDGRRFDRIRRGCRGECRSASRNGVLESLVRHEDERKPGCGDLDQTGVRALVTGDGLDVLAPLQTPICCVPVTECLIEAHSSSMRFGATFVTAALTCPAHVMLSFTDTDSASRYFTRTWGGVTFCSFVSLTEIVAV